MRASFRRCLVSRIGCAAVLADSEAKAAHTGAGRVVTVFGDTGVKWRLDACCAVSRAHWVCGGCAGVAAVPAPAPAQRVWTGNSTLAEVVTLVVREKKPHLESRMAMWLKLVDGLDVDAWRALSDQLKKDATANDFVLLGTLNTELNPAAPLAPAPALGDCPVAVILLLLRVLCICHLLLL